MVTPSAAYPYLTGHREETGTGAGLGSTVNVPLAKGTEDDEYIDVLTDVCGQIAAFGPELLVVSLGLDTFFDDPISDLSLTADGFERCGALVRQLGVPTVVLQEGGYATDELGENTRRWLVGVSSPVPAGSGPD